MRWLLVLTKFRSPGIPLTEIRSYSELDRHGPGTRAVRCEILRPHEADVLEQLAEL